MSESKGKSQDGDCWARGPRRLPRLIAILAALLVLVPLAAAQEGVPDRLSGQVPIEDQLSGRSQKPYMENVRLVGQNNIKDRGMNGNLDWIGDCAYVAAYYGANDPLSGLAVVDASNPTDPVLVEIKPGVPGTRESQVEANEVRNLVIVMPWASETPFFDEPGVSQLDIYQADPNDCTALERVGTYEFGTKVGTRNLQDIVTHEHLISPDGNVVYATVSGSSAAGPALTVVDIRDPANPTKLTTWDLSDIPGRPESGAHDLDLSKDGRRAYVLYRYDDENGVSNRGLAILDTSEVVDQVPDPKITLVGEITWDPPEDVGGSHTATFVTIAGRQYVLAQDETFNRRGCPWGWARIIDVTDEANPLQISSIRLDVSMRRNCAETTPDQAMYSTHYMGVDNPDDAKLAFFTWYSSGLRIWDIRDPYNPVEIGYYIPGADPDTVLPGTETEGFDRDFYDNRNVDYTYSYVRYMPETGHIWFNSVFNGFQIVELVKGLDELDAEAAAGN